MKIIGDTTEDDMVAAFLKAEANSLRWGESIKKLLDEHKINKNIIDSPDITNQEENSLRAIILGEFRGYKQNKDLFENFPQEVNWKRAILSGDDFQKIKYIDYDY